MGSWNDSGMSLKESIFFSLDLILMISGKEIVNHEPLSDSPVRSLMNFFEGEVSNQHPCEIGMFVFIVLIAELNPVSSRGFINGAVRVNVYLN